LKAVFFILQYTFPDLYSESVFGDLTARVLRGPFFALFHFAAPSGCAVDHLTFRALNWLLQTCLFCGQLNAIHDFIERILLDDEVVRKFRALLMVTLWGGLAFR
jgi:hypothetical protein